MDRLLVVAVGEGRDGVPGGRLGPPQDLRAQVFQIGQAELFEVIEQPVHPDLVAGHLSVHVAEHLVGRPDVGGEQPEQLFVGASPLVELGDGEVQPLLVDL